MEEQGYTWEIYQSDEKAEAIIKVIAQAFHTTPGDIKGKSRHGPLVMARHFCMFFIRDKYKDLSLKQIGALFSGRDHATVIHAVRNIKQQLEVSSFYRKTFAHLEELVNAL